MSTFELHVAVVACAVAVTYFETGSCGQSHLCSHPQTQATFLVACLLVFHLVLGLVSNLSFLYSDRFVVLWASEHRTAEPIDVAQCRVRRRSSASVSRQDPASESQEQHLQCALEQPSASFPLSVSVSVFAFRSDEDFPLQHPPFVCADHAPAST